MQNTSQCLFFFFSRRRRHTRLQGDWSSDVCSSDLSPRVRAQVHAAEGVVRDVARDVGPIGDRLHQIGRASCRESVDLGGRRIIKKKKKKKRRTHDEYIEGNI